jgi:hypothetical protein
VRTPSCRLNLRLIHRTVSKVMTPIDKKSTTGPNIIDHKVELPTIKACPTVFQLLECTLSQIGNPISQRTEIATPIFCQPFIADSQHARATRTIMITAPRNKQSNRHPFLPWPTLTGWPSISPHLTPILTVDGTVETDQTVFATAAVCSFTAD